MLVVLIMIAMIAGMVTPQIAGVSAVARERTQLEELAARFATSRVEAMRQVKTMNVAGDLADGLLALSVNETGDKRWRPWRTDLQEDVSSQDGRFRVVFDARGRTTSRVLVFNAQDDSGRIWAIRFDPISGTPSLHREDEDQSTAS